MLRGAPETLNIKADEVTSTYLIVEPARDPTTPGALSIAIYISSDFGSGNITLGPDGSGKRISYPEGHTSSALHQAFRVYAGDLEAGTVKAFNARMQKHGYVSKKGRSHAMWQGVSLGAPHGDDHGASRQSSF